jgi:hypothetical protein
MPSRRTIRDASKKLPENVRGEFIALFKECGIMDLYCGDLLEYFRIIHQILQRQNTRIKEYEEKMKEIINIATTSPRGR